MKKKRRPKLGSQFALISQRNRVHIDKKKERSRKSCRNYKHIRG